VTKTSAVPPIQYFPSSLTDPDVLISKPQLAAFLGVSIDSVDRIPDGPAWVHVTDRLVRSSALAWLGWLQQKREAEQAVLARKAEAAAALPAPVTQPAKPRGRPRKPDHLLKHPRRQKTVTVRQPDPEEVRTLGPEGDLARKQGEGG
jgi:hypothetical protein